MGIFSWSKTAASNTSLEGISWAEGMARANVNNGVRAIAAALKGWQEDLGGGLTAGGTANALTLSTNSSILSYADGQMFGLVAANTNTSTTVTLNVDSVGTRRVKKITPDATEVDIDIGDIADDGHYLVQYDASANSAAGAWILLNPATGHEKQAEVALTSATTTTWNLALGTNFNLDIAHAVILAAPTNARIGKRGLLRVFNDSGTDKSFTFGAVYRGSVPDLGAITVVNGQTEFFEYYVLTATNIIVTVAVFDT